MTARCSQKWPGRWRSGAGLQAGDRRRPSTGFTSSGRVDASCPAEAGARGRRPLSVCLYTPSVNPSGMGAHMLDLAAEYLPDVHVSVMAWATPGGCRVLQGAAKLGAATLGLPHPRDPAFKGTIVGFLESNRVDVFHVHVASGRENFDGARSAREAGVPVVVQTQHLPWLFGSHKHRVPFFRAIGPVDRLITLCQAQCRTYERIGVPPATLATVPNGVRPRPSSPGRSAARARLELDPNQRVVLTIGRLTGQKGHRYLIESIPRLVADFPDVSVVILGDGHLDEQLCAQAAGLGVGDRVRLVGYRPDARILDAADIFVLPSLQEGMPLAALEAMEAGLAVVATRVIGTSEVVTNGETGTLVPPQNPPALAGAIGSLLADPVRCARYGDEGRRRYLDRFTSGRMAAETLAVYQDVLVGTGSRGAP